MNFPDWTTREQSGIQGQGRSKLRPSSPEWVWQRAQLAAPLREKQTGCLVAPRVKCITGSSILAHFSAPPTRF